MSASALLIVIAVLVIAVIGFALYGLVALIRQKTAKTVSDFSAQGAPMSTTSAKDSLFLRALIIAGIVVALLIPAGFLVSVIDERAELYDEAIHNIAKLWGEYQTISGPALVIPYEAKRIVTEKDDSKKDVKREELYTAYRVILPKQVDFNAELSPQTRYRGIYNYVVYSAPVGVKGTFDLPDPVDFGDDVTRIHWDQAFFSLGVADLKAIVTIDNLSWQNRAAPSFNPNTGLQGLLGPGFHTRVALDAAQKKYDFALNMQIKGSGGIFFTPVGEATNITISGNWPSPSFDGSLLPTSRTVTGDGFTATWRVPHLSRTYPQSGALDGYLSEQADDGSVIRSFTVGVNLYESVSLYRLVTRAVKYGILFIGLTFVVLFSFELVTRTQLHLVQYGFVGIAMSLFYLMLLSLSEHIPFWQAFVAASLVSIVMNGLYIAAGFRSKTKGLIIASLLAGLYGVLYALLQLEGYTLLVGTALVVIVVAALMFLTRNLADLSKEGTKTSPETGAAA